jgi:hypothetical protein
MIHKQWPMRVILTDEDTALLDSHWGTDLYEPCLMRVIKKYQELYDFLLENDE